MEFFGNILTAEIIARLFYSADKEIRREMTDVNNPLEVNEPERVASLCSMVRRKLSRNPFIRSISIQAHARDTHERDAMFVFRFKDEIKVGIFEAKLLRIKNANLNDTWDWQNRNTGNSHFTEQVINQQKWLNIAAVWDMFIPNCDIGLHSPSLDRAGSSNIWADEMFGNANISRPHRLWTYQNVLDAKDQYLSLYTIIKEILKCNKGTLIDAKGLNSLRIYSDNNVKSMDVPIPRSQYGYAKRIKEFLSKNEAIGSFNYYRFDDLYESVKDYKQNQKVNVLASIMQKRSYNEKSIKLYEDQVLFAYNLVKDELK